MRRSPLLPISLLLCLLLPLSTWAGTPLSQGKGLKKGLLKRQEPSLEPTGTLKTLTVVGGDEPATLSTLDISLRSLSESGEESYPHRVLLLDNFGAYAAEAARIKTILEGLGATVTYLVSDSRNLGNEEIRTNPFDQIWYLDLATGTSYSGLDCSRTASWYQGRLTGIWADQRNNILSPWRQAHGAAVVDGLLHLLGGRVYNGTLVLQHHVYDPKTETWSSKADLPTGRDYLAVVAAGRRILAIGGSSAAQLLPIPETDPDPSLAVTEIYDVDSDTWATGAPMPTPRYGLVAAQVGGKVYAIGGRSGATNLSVVEEYDPETDRWSTKASMPTPRHAGACAVIDGKIHVLGGSGNSSYTNAHEVYDPVADTWSSSTPMLTKRAGLAAASVGGKLYAMDGYNATDGGGLRISRCFDPVTAEWTTGPSFHYACLRSASVVDGVIHFLGGVWTYGESAQPYHDVFDPPKPDRGLICDGRLHFSLTEARATHGAAIVQNYYEALRSTGGGLVVATYGNAQSDYGADNVLAGIRTTRFEQFSFSGSTPFDSGNPLMSTPNSLGTSLPHDGTTPGRAPRYLQSSGQIVYPVAWTLNYGMPVVSSTIKGLAGMQVQITQPADGDSELIHRPVTFEAVCTEAQPPISYTWTSDRDGPLGTGATLITSALSLGMHEITVRAIDARSFGAEERISFAVNPDDLPDLVASSLSVNPDSALSERDPVSLTVRVSNEGNSACTEAVDVDFLIDGVSIGRVVLSASLASGAATELTTTWSAVKGDHQLSVMIDPDDQLLELQKENNQAWLDLPRVADVFPPEPPTNLRIANTYYDRLGFSWDASVNSAGDLAGYRVYVDGSSIPQTLSASSRSFYLYSLAPGSKHSIAITSVDGAGNESEPLAGTDYTLFHNPSNLVATPYSGYMAASWSGVSPVENLKHYAVYVEEASFTSVSGLTPKVCTLNTSASVAQLVDGVTYYVAVTAVNAGDGEAPGVTPVSINAIPDEFGPEISNLRFDGVAVEDGATLTHSGTLAVQAQDPAGVSRVEFYVGGSLVHSVVDTGPDYTMPWDLLVWEDGTYVLEVKAFDSFANGSTTTQSLVVALAPPAAATILSPADGLVTDQSIVQISGSGTPGTTAVIYMDGQILPGQEALIDITGSFRLSVNLAEGSHQFTAASRNRAGIGPQGAAKTWTLDTSGPERPLALSAEGRSGGVIELAWAESKDAPLVGYHVYRSTTAFSLKAEGTRITAAPVSKTSFLDTPLTGGTFHYGVTAVDELGRESTLSPTDWALADGVPPRAVSLAYAPSNFDPVSQRMGPGSVAVELTMSEELSETPFLSINPEGFSPLVVTLSKTNETVYTGSLIIPADVPSGSAYAVLSAKDLLGNRGTEIETGESVLIDARPPVLRRIVIEPSQPVKNDGDNPVSVVVRLGLDEAQVPGTPLAASVLLSRDGRVPIPLSSLVEVPAVEGDGQTWQGQFTMPADAGADGGESFSFEVVTRDDLGNEGTIVTCENQFQVFEGDLPPLAVPTGLVATAYPEGEVRLQWNAVTGTVGYRLFRRAPGEAELSFYQDLATETSFTETPSVEGVYAYAVASKRLEFDMTSFSAPCEAVEVNSDATAPGVPQELTLSLGSRGVECRWVAPSFTESMTFTVYRASGDSLMTASGVPALASGLSVNTFVDGSPTPLERCYAVTARDAAGNESAPSPSATIDMSILPVSSLAVRQVDQSLPELTWTHEGTALSGFEVAVDDVAVASLAREAHSYTDTGFSGGTGRHYKVTALSDEASPSLPRSIFLPAVSIVRDGSAPICRGLVNRLTYVLSLEGTVPVSDCVLHLDFPENRFSSTSFSLLPGEEKRVDVLVPGLGSFADSMTPQARLEILPGLNEAVEIVRSQNLECRDSSLVVTLKNEEFLSGGMGTVRFSLENPGDDAIDVVTALPGGRPSDEVTILLKSLEGDVLASRSVLQQAGDGIFLVPNGMTVARVQPGETFHSAPIEVALPQATPETIDVELVIGQTHWRTGRPESVVLPGVKSRREIQLANTAYRGEVTAVSPERSAGNEPVMITGRAIERATGEALPLATLKLVIMHDGFRREFEVVSDEAGEFSYSFVALPGEGGSYEVSATHPSLHDTYEQGTFWIDRVVVSPTNVDLTMPRNYQQTIDLRLENVGGDLENLRFAYSAESQPGAVLAQGIQVGLPEARASFAHGERVNLSITISADNTGSDDAPSIVLDLLSGDEGTKRGQVAVNLSLAEAVPVLTVAPGVLETGMALDESVNETVMLRNQGLASAENLSCVILNEDKQSEATWVRVSSNGAMSSLAVGSEAPLTLTFLPRTDFVTEGSHLFFLRIRSDNHPDVHVPIQAVVTGSGVGNVLFHVSDIYTDTLHPDTQEPIPGVAGATIRVQNELVTSVSATMTTTSGGAALLTELPTGRYIYRVSASGHEDCAGYLWIKPGITGSESCFLKSNLVTVEFGVVETTIEDSYTIGVVATFETNVPAAVVVADPVSTTLPAMEAGDVFAGSYRLTNHGLIRAENLRFTPPQSDEEYRFEFLQGALPTKLDAGESVQIPFRVVCLQGGEPASSASGGELRDGVCRPKIRTETCRFQVTCSNGVSYEESKTRYFVLFDPDCADMVVGGLSSRSTRPTTDTQPVAEDISVDRLKPTTTEVDVQVDLDAGEVKDRTVVINVVQPAPDSDDGAGVSPTTKPKPAPNTLTGTTCTKVEIDRTVVDEEFGGSSFWQNVGCAVSELDGSFYDDGTDLAVKVPGGVVAVKRHFLRQAVLSANGPVEEYGWHFDYGSFDRIELFDTEGTKEGILRTRGRVFKLVQPDTWKSRDQIITREPRGFCWRDKYGNWKNYNTVGWLTEVGGLEGLSLSIECDDHGNVSVIKDRNGQPAVYFYYTAGVLTRVKSYLWHQIDYVGLLGGVNGNSLLLTKVLSYSDPSTTHTATYDYSETKMIRKVDQGGRAVTIGYDGEGRVSFVENGDGSGHVFAYGVNELTKQRYCETRFSSGKIKKRWFDADGFERRMDVDGRTVSTSTPTSDGLLVTLADEKGRQIRKRYDAHGNAYKLEFVSAGGTIEAKFDPRFNLVTWSKDRSGLVTTKEYDSAGHLIRCVEAPGTSAERVFTYTYVGTQLRAATIEGDETAPAATTIFTYDDRDNIASITDPEGNTTHYSGYNLFGQATSIRDSRGNVWAKSYDNLGRLIAETDPLGHTTRYEWDGANQMTALVNAAGKRTTFGYDFHGNQTLVRDPLGHALQTTYNSLGLPVRVRDASGHVIENKYDSEGRLKYSYAVKPRDYRLAPPSIIFSEATLASSPLVATAEAVGDLPSLNWDADPTTVVQYQHSLSTATMSSSYKPSRIIRPRQTQDIEYDRNDQVKRIVTRGDDGTDLVHSFAYNDAGSVVLETRADGTMIRYSYDARDRRTKTIAPDGGVTEVVYDVRNNPIRVTDPEGRITTMQWDRLNRLVKKILPLGEETTYAYDAGGNLEWTVKANGNRIRRVYDTANRCTRVEYFSADNPSAPTKTIEYGYNSLNQLVSWSDGVCSGNLVYDDAGRKTSESVDYGPFSLEYGYDYHANGLKRSIRYPDGSELGFNYSESNRLSSVAVPGAGTISLTGYEAAGPQWVQFPGGRRIENRYDSRANVERIEESDPAGQVVFIHEYGIDSLGQLTSINTLHGTYEYDYVHERLTHATTPGLQDENYVYDLQSNRKPADDPDSWFYDANDRLLQCGDRQFIYDGNGNVRSRTGGERDLFFEHDVADRLVCVTDGSDAEVCRYHYDPFGRRLWKEVGGQRTYYFYSEEGLLGEYDASGTEIVSYGWGPGSAWCTDPIFQRRNGQYYWYVNDYKGTPVRLVESRGTTVWEGRYDAFGQCQVVEQSVENNFRLPGQYFDAETGLHWNFQRHYDPSTGRYLERDPLEDGLNHYAYVGGNPVCGIDPEGLCLAKVWRFYWGVTKVYAGYTALGLILTSGITVGAAVIPGLLAAGAMLFGIHEILASTSCLWTGHDLDAIGHLCNKALAGHPMLAEAATILVSVLLGSGIEAGLAVVGRRAAAAKAAAKAAALGSAAQAAESSAAKGIGLGYRRTSIALRSGAVPYSGSTKMAHSLSKRVNRHPEIWGKTTGNMNTWHGQAMQHFREIARGPGSFEKVRPDRIWWIEKRLSDGRGIRLQLDYQFKGFIDPE